MKTIINIKTDKKVKKSAQKIAADLGFSLSAVINAHLKQFIRNKEVYFSIAPRMSLELENLIGKVEIDIKKNKNISSAFSSEQEVRDYFSGL
jgi:addiction module RelB/DinJ family antitoxin